MKKVLLIDDDPITGKMYAEEFTGADYYAEWTINGKTGLSALARLKPDVVVLSYSLPDISGAELISKLRETPDLPPTGIVALLPAADDATARAARRAGAHRAVVKLRDNILRAARESIDEALRAASKEPQPLASPEPSAEAELPAADTGLGLHEDAAPGVMEEAPPIESEAAAPVPPQEPTPAEKLHALARALFQARSERERILLVPQALAEAQRLCEEGAPVVRRIAQALAALLKELQAKSECLNPSTIRTAHQAAALIERASNPAKTTVEVPQRKWRVLAVDDEVVARMTIAKALTSVELEAETAKDPNEALALLQQRKYDLFVLDVVMPGMSGFELCEKLRASRAHAETPVIFVTARSDFESRLRFARSGGDDFIAKPFITSELATKALQHVLSRYLSAHQDQPSASNARPSGTAAPPSQTPRPTASPRLGGAEDTAHTPSVEQDRLRASAKLKVLSRSLMQADRDDKRLPLLREIAELNQTFAQAEAEAPLLARLAKTLEHLLKDLQQSPDRVTPSTVRTVQQSVEFLDKLIARRLVERSLGSARVLGVDDEVVARMTVAKAMALIQVETETAKAPAEALEFLQNRTYDLFILDVNMPGMDGFELCSKLRGSKAHAKTPVIFATARSDFESRLRFARSGADDYIAKPFPASELAVKALQHLIQKQLQLA